MLAFLFRTNCFATIAKKLEQVIVPASFLGLSGSSVSNLVPQKLDLAVDWGFILVAELVPEGFSFQIRTAAGSLVSSALKVRQLT